MPQLLVMSWDESQRHNAEQRQILRYEVTHEINFQTNTFSHIAQKNKIEIDSEQQ
jgi:hypothetical protein